MRSAGEETLMDISIIVKLIKNREHLEISSILLKPN